MPPNLVDEIKYFISLMLKPNFYLNLFINFKNFIATN